MISIRRGLFLVCLLLIMAPLAMLWVWPHARLLEQETKAANEHHLLVARTLARTVERYQLDLSTAFGVVADELVSAQGTLPDARQLRSFDVLHVVVAERFGGVVTAALEVTRAAPTSPLDADLLARMRIVASDSNIAITGVEPGSDGRPVFRLVKSAGSKIVVATVDTRYLSSLVRAVRFGTDGHAVIIDQTGHLAAFPKTADAQPTSDLSAVGVVRRVLAGEAGVGEIRAPALGVDMMAGFSPVRGTGWGVLVPQPTSELRDAASSIRRHVFFIFASGLLIAALIAVRAGLMITAPLQRLNAGARRLAEGNLDARVECDPRTTPLELAILTANFNDMADRLACYRQTSTEQRERAERANRSKTDFVRTVTHELRSPVNAILGFSELLTSRSASRISPEMRDSYLRDISAGARHLLSLVNDLLDMSKMESGQYELQEQDFWVDEITLRTTRYLEVQARERGVSVDVIFDGEPPMIHADERAIFQSLLNLVSNAVRYGRRGGTVAISCRITSSGELELVVADDGPGIAPEDLERVMLPFQRARTGGTEQITGSGLGLPIVKRLVELHGGSLTLTSELGSGTRATILLPPDRVRQVAPEIPLCHPQAPKLAVAHAA